MCGLREVYGIAVVMKNFSDILIVLSIVFGETVCCYAMKLYYILVEAVCVGGLDVMKKKNRIKNKRERDCICYEQRAES